MHKSNKYINKTNKYINNHVVDGLSVCGGEIYRLSICGGEIRVVLYVYTSV